MFGDCLNRKRCIKMTTKEVAQVCGVSVPTVTENAKKVGIVLENGKAHEWTEEEVRKVQTQLMKNQMNQGTQIELVKNEALNRFKAGMTLMEIVRSGNVEAMKELMDLSMAAVTETAKAKELEAQNKLLLEQKEQLQLDYQNEMEEHQKDKELVLHKYLTATQIKETIWKEYGKSIVVSKIVKRIPLEDNDILYKPFKNGNFTGQQPVYHPNVLDKIREILG